MMKRKNIFGIILATGLVLASSCSKEPDMSVVDKWLGEDFNQELLWNLDSLAFHRATWTVSSVTDGVQMRKASVKMMGAMRSISYLSYSPDEFKTFVGYSEQTGTVADLAAAQSGALFAISGVSVPEYFKYNGTVVNSSTDNPSQVNGVVAIPSSLASNVFSIYNCADGNYSSIQEENVMATGAVLVVGGKEQTFPKGDYYDKRMARSIIGFDLNTGNYIFATIDKGAAGQAEGATIAEAAFIARMMGMTEAVCLADGDAATMWSKEAGVLNVPSSASPAKVSSVLYVAVNEPSLEGKGTAAEPYIIDMAVKMKQMRKYSPVGGETYFKLTQDLNMSTVKTWFPVNWDGDFDRKIHFDGNGKTITGFAPNAFVDNVTGEATSYPSLFGVLYGTCKNLTITNSKINAGAKPSAGFLGGYIGTASKPGIVENVHLKNCEISGTNTTYGGLGGNAREATIKNCSVEIVIRAGGADVGGIAGIGNGTVTIENCTADVDLAAQQNPGGNMRYGGILGYHKGTVLTIKNSQATGDIACGYSCNTAAGIVAYSGSSTSTTISQCKSSVNLMNDSGKALSNTGGIVGNHGGAGTCTIENCYSNGTMDLNQRNGGLVGAQEQGVVNIINSYSSSSINGFSGLGSLVGVVTGASAQLKMTACLGWSPSIKSARPDKSKWCCGALVGSVEGKLTATGCVRRADMTFTDAVRTTLESHGPISASTPAGEQYNHPYDGTASSAETASAAAKAAGWSETIWDLTGDLPELKIFK